MFAGPTTPRLPVSSQNRSFRAPEKILASMRELVHEPELGPLIKWARLWRAGGVYLMGALEKHYTVTEIAELWHFSPDTVRALFRNRPGVLKIGTGETLHKRAYISLRIPESILQQVHAELRTVPGHARKRA
jgi:hypothetical protein